MVLDGTKLRPVRFYGRLNSEGFCRIVEEDIIPQLREIYGEDWRNIVLQQDGCPAHTAQ